MTIALTAETGCIKVTCNRCDHHDRYRHIDAEHLSRLTRAHRHRGELSDEKIDATVDILTAAHRRMDALGYPRARVAA